MRTHTVPRCKIWSSMKTIFEMTYRFGIVLLVVYWVALFVATHLPGDSVSSVQVSDKLLHVVAYFGLTCLLAFVVLGYSRRPPYLYAVILLIVAVYGALDEFTQTFAVGRYADVGDWFCDLGGAVLGLAGYYRLQTLVAQFSFSDDSATS